MLEILSQRKDICKYAIVESVLVIPSKFTYSMIKSAFGSCYGLIKYKWFSKLQDSFIQVLPNMYHGEFSINHADDYVRKLLEIVKRR